MLIPSNISIFINAAANEVGVDPKLLISFASIESNFNVNAKSGTNVRGLFQITGDTWKSYRQNVAYSTDPYEQAKTAALIIKDLSKRYDGNIDLIGIAYNAGSGVANQLIGKEVNYENVKNATLKHFGYAKVDEVWYYPKKLRAAYGGEYTIGKDVTIAPTAGSSAREQAPISTGDVTVTEPIKSDVPFFECFDQNARNQISQMKSIMEKLPIQTLRYNLSHGKLAPLAKIMDRNLCKLPQG